jgi:hypothetical protein
MTGMIADPLGLDEFLFAYIEAALWSSTDDGEPLDKSYASETVARMRADCIKFLNHRLGGRLVTVAERLEAEGGWNLPAGTNCSIIEYAGHDFWLTRCGHGCGFWDGDWPMGIAEGLDRLSQVFGHFDVYIGDDSQLHGG